MIIEHRYKNKKVSRQLDDKNIAFMLTNQNGSFFCQGLCDKSRYDGFFVFEPDGPYKIIDEVLTQNNPQKIINNIYSVTKQTSQEITEEYILPSQKNSLVILFSNPSTLNLHLDIRHIFDDRDFGRNFVISENKNKIIINYKKQNDNSVLEYEYFVVLNKGQYKVIGDWIKKYYAFDAKRNSPPTERYVYRAVSIEAKDKVVISVARNLKDAIKENTYMLKNISKIKKAQSKKISVRKKIKDAEVFFAYINAANSLVSLQKNGGIMAGLPWFFEHWSRDELLCCKALMQIKKSDLSQKILKKYSQILIQDDFIHSIYPQKGLRSADAFGWLFKRLDDLAQINKKETAAIKNTLLEFEAKHLSTSTKDILIKNNALETWMDTDPNNTGRAGYRIEMQAFLLMIYDMLYRHTKDKKYLESLELLKNRIINKFYYKGVLFDGLDDATIRPNIFLAAYIYYGLFDKKTWSDIFSYSLPKLWNPWGGLATIDKSHPTFQNTHTGQDNKSYHQGDSWYFINNIAAKVLYKTDKKLFENYIKKILEASVNEIIYMGYIGHHAELSSSQAQESQGCRSQAWSTATFIELINEIYK